MKYLILLLALVGYGHLAAQTLTINAHTAEVSSSQKNDIYPIEALYFSYNSATGVFTANRVDNRNLVFSSDVTNVTSTGDATASEKIATIQGTHLRAVKGTITTLIPKRSVSVLYKSSGKGLEIQAVGAMKLPPIWAGHVDSVKFSTADSTTTLRLAALRKINLPSGSSAPSIAAGAAAGSSPTVAVIGGATAGRITITTGSSPTTTGVIATVTLPVKHPTGSFVTLTPADSDAAAHVARVFVTSTTTTVVLNASGTALSAATEYIFNYQVSGY